MADMEIVIQAGTLKLRYARGLIGGSASRTGLSITNDSESRPTFFLASSSIEASSVRIWNVTTRGDFGSVDEVIEDDDVDARLVLSVFSGTSIVRKKKLAPTI
jgi:hypothetical protein